jgi:competence protein ComEA
MLIKVSGDVEQPGIYEVPANTLAITVIKMALPVKPLGSDTVEAVGTSPLLNGSAVSLTAGVDGSPHITVGCMTVNERMVLRIPLDIAKMSEADFSLLPGIGPSLARRIVMKRQENGGVLHLNDLATIEGIGEKKMALIRKYVQPAEIKN